MRFTQATLFALSSGALSGLTVSAAPIGAGGKRGLVATAEVLSCGTNDGGLTVQPGRAGNCPVGWGRPHYNDKICVEIEGWSSSHHPASTHEPSPTHKSAAHSTNKAMHSSAHKSSSTHKSKSTSHLHSTQHSASSTHKSHSHSSASTHRASPVNRHTTSTSHKASPTPKPTTPACGQDQTYNELLSLCVDLDLGDVASIGRGLKLGNPLGPGAKAPLASAGVSLDLGDVANIGGGLKLGGPGAKASTSSRGASSTSKAGNAKATATPSSKCSDEDALLHLCVKVGNLVDTDTSVLGNKGLVNTDSTVAGIPIKATVAGKNGKLVDADVAGGAVKASVGGQGKPLVSADVGNGAVKATVGGKDGLVNANVGSILQVSSSPTSGAHKQGGETKCPQGQVLHLGVCVDLHANVLGIKADAVADIAL